ncbi:hypothetical protein Tco_0620255 [Tanacetum coccineum]
MSLNNDLRGHKDLHNWYQSLGALDLGSQVLLVYLVNAAKRTHNLVLGWDKDSVKLKKAVFGFIEDVITKTIDYHLFDVIVEFHREIHDLNFRGSSCKNLFVLSSSNRGRLLGFTDLMRQKNKRMKQEGLIQHYGILEDLNAATWDDHTINGGTLVLLVYLVNAAKVNSWNVSTYNSTNLVLGWDKDSIKLKKAVFGFIEDVITKTIDYHLFDVVVEFHRFYASEVLLSLDYLHMIAKNPKGNIEYPAHIQSDP